MYTSPGGCTLATPIVLEIASMGKKKKIHLRNCRDCNKEFMGTKYSHLCKECRIKHQQKGYALYLESRTNKREKEMLEGLDNLVSLRREPKEPIKFYEDCPNYNKDLVKCVTCPAGSWRYKGCGTSK